MHFCTDDQCTPAHYAGANGHVRCFQCLLEHGADISLKNKNPLDVARKHGKPHAISKAGECIILWTLQPSKNGCYKLQRCLHICSLNM